MILVMMGNIASGLVIFLFIVQLRGSEVLPVVRLNKQGFPKSMSLAEFKRRFMLLSSADGAAMSATGDDQSTVKNILLDADVDESSYRIGLSEVSFSRNCIVFFIKLQGVKVLLKYRIRILPISII